MKVTYSWLKKFVNLKAPVQELAEKLTMAGLEVVSLEKHGQEDVLEIEITSNRPDWLSVLGIAREVSAIYGLKLREEPFKKSGIKNKGKIPVKIALSDKKDCPFYSVRTICDVRVGESPDWLKQKLEALGCRSVNNVVDITNYCLFELGQPLHAFDLDKLNQKEVRIRRAQSGEKITTIDGQDRQLSGDILVIADGRRPVAVAGIMGGKETEVNLQTHNILLESAVFDPVLVRRARAKLGLQSESAYRFERGVSREGASRASLAAQEMIMNLAGGRLCGFKSLGAPVRQNPKINLEMDYLNKILGTEISSSCAGQILTGLGFKVKVSARRLAAEAPQFRQDIKLPVDLAEEVARIYGYSRIPVTLPAVKPGQKNPDAGDFNSRVKNILCALGLNEAITYSLIDRKLLQDCAQDDFDPIWILNPLSKEQEILRPTLLPSLLRAVAYNLDQQQEEVGIFEIADIFTAAKSGPGQKPVLGIALCGSKKFFTKQGLQRDEITALHLKGVLERLFNRLGIKEFSFSRKNDDEFEILVNQEEAGTIRQPKEQALLNFDIKNRLVILAQLDLEKIYAGSTGLKKFSEIPKYPAINRDISFMVSLDTNAGQILDAVRAAGTPLLTQARIADYYQGKQIPQGFRGLTIACTYRSDSRTLTEEEVSPVHGKICSLLQERFGIRLR